MKKQKNFRRRDFIKSLSILSLIPFIQSCENSVSGFWSDDNTGTNRDRPSIPAKPNVDILFEGTEEQIAQKIQNKHTVIQDLYNNPGKELTIGFPQEDNYNVLKISFIKDEIVSYPHLRLVNKKTNEVANVIWGMDGIYPSIKFVDNSGNTIIKNGRALEFSLNLPERLSKINSPVDWILNGIKIFGIALVLWLGFTIAKYIIAALAFIAFNAMAIGLVIVGAVIIIQIIKWILDITGITMSDIVSFFTMTLNNLVRTLIDIVNYILANV